MSDDLGEDELASPVGPAFPKTVSIAGIIWIVFGGWIILIAGLVYAVERPGATFPLSMWGFIFGAAFVYVGVHTVRGTARAMGGNGVGSIVLAVLILIHLFSVVVALPNQKDAILVASIIDAGMATVGAVGFLAAGVLALLGRENYRAWLRAQKNCKTTHDT
jgi:fucose 4-O-acetylase-like acetyltransferase